MMKVYIVDVSFVGQADSYVKIFNSIVINQLQYYGVYYTVVNMMNISRNKNQLCKDSLVVLYNEYKIETNASSEIGEFLTRADEVKAEIWPIAIDRDKRMPMDKISKKQSYDVWEQLRCRDLGEEYIPTIAKAFSRKIVSRVFPTFYSECGEVFLSHRRLDGEEITAKIFDKILLQADSVNPFRDVVKVKVGEEAQSKIDEAMENSDVFIFIHTPKSAQSDWILKELRYAILRNIPILWIQIDGADVSQLKVKPSDNPHLNFITKDFEKDDTLVKIVDEILDKAFELIMLNSNKIFDYLDTIEKLFEEKSVVKDRENMLYCITAKRKGYHYPQRDIVQYYQIYGRTPTEDDAKKLRLKLVDESVDSITILTNRIIKLSKRQNVVFDSIEDFYYHWDTYLNVRRRETSNMEIIISGAFPDSNEIYKQSLTDALVLFAKVIMKSGYQLTFGSHPTFQELFFELAEEVNAKEARNILNMYISQWFNYDDKKEYYKSRCKLFEYEKKSGKNESLSVMRQEMIQRQNVKALVCLGGKVKHNKIEEGIREEIKLALEANIPVFIVGSVGGCSAEVALEYKKVGWNKINSASAEINEEFLSSIDYFKIAQEMINCLSK